MSVNITSVSAPPTPVQQVQTATLANLQQGANKIMVIDDSNNIGYKNVSSSSFAEFYLTNNGTATSLTSNTPALFSSTAFISNPLSSNFTLATNSAATYTGTQTSNFFVQCNITCTSGTNNQLISFTLYKNGSALPSSKCANRVDNGLSNNAICSSLVSLATNDKIELYITNSTASNAVTVTDLSFELFNVN